jgi:hypothetical protein
MWLEDYDDFIKEVGVIEAEKEYTIAVYDDANEGGNDKKGKGKAKGREVTMVMGLEKDTWTRLCSARRKWRGKVEDELKDVEKTLGLFHKYLAISL